MITTHEERGNGIVTANPLLMAYHSVSTALIAALYCEAGKGGGGERQTEAGGRGWGQRRRTRGWDRKITITHLFDGDWSSKISCIYTAAPALLVVSFVKFFIPSFVKTYFKSNIYSHVWHPKV